MRDTKQTPDFFGSKHEIMLEQYSHLIARDHPVLDIGMGRGEMRYSSPGGALRSTDSIHPRWL